ncbi:putative Rad4 transglutaminase-like domain-containing protein [Seiridium cardinale]|uniref:Rad4 transglutaminase-like domain-containing protein n=1 Tax=Seiridium cardinale TaxID=138064 RepID=A0ABR2XC66_9PEZI
MPPHLPRKRLRSTSPGSGDRAKKGTNNDSAKTPKAVAPPRKSTLFEDLDASSKSRSAEKTKSALQQMVDDDDGSSSLSSLSDSDIEFEDVPAAKRQKVAAPSGEDDEDEDEEIEFEDVPNHKPQPEADPIISGDLELTLFRNNNHVPLASEMSKKGPSKREKLMRNATHCIHVQFLLWHNAVRNSWLCDQEVQAIMISHLSPRLWEEVDRWRTNSGLDKDDDVEEEAKVIPATKKGTKGKAQPKGKANTRSKGKQPAPKAGRDWGDAAGRLEKGAPDLSHGDPLFRLMKSLSAWWKQRFKITAPGLRKKGYMDVRRLAKWRQSFEEEEHDPEKFGEKIIDLDDFRLHAQRCEGSRDVGAQLFTALLRGIGLEARMAANLQSLGYGWNKSEEADEEKTPGEASSNGAGTPTQINGKKPQEPARTKKTPARPASRRSRKSDKDALKMDLDDSDEFAEAISDDSDDDSVIDVTAHHTKPRPAPKVYDKDLDFPLYWTEVLSPVTHKWLPVDPIVKSVIGTNRELIESLEPRGAKADKAKQIMAYVVGYSRDGTAKDVTVRYLRKQLFPGRTKGCRMGVEKIPIYNKYGKVKRYERFDWFKFALSGYGRGSPKHPITELDNMEDATDLTPAVPEKKEVKEGEETLQYYKTSKEYVLQRHLKREEALLPTATPVKVFRNKGKGGKVDEEDVYSRKDVVSVKSAETWHKQGRAPLPGAEPLKHAPYRAATTNRRREIAEAEARTGEKVMQPLYSEEQTDWIIPPPIENGVIPKNDYGNIDMFAEHMCPEGAVHLPYRGAVRVCKRMGIDYAEAVVGFEFGHRMAVPVIRGVVVAEEHEEKVLEEIEKDEAERQRKEDEKRRKTALGMWRKLLMGMRIAARIKEEYGHLEDKETVDLGTNGDVKSDDGEGGFVKMSERDEDMAGGFLPEGYEEEDPEDEPRHTSSYFPVAHEDDGRDTLEVDHGDADEKLSAFPVEHSLGRGDGNEDRGTESEEEEVKPAPRTRRRVAQPKPKARASTSSRRRSRRTKVESSEEEDDDDEFKLSDSD